MPSSGHFVQLYRAGDAEFAKNVGQYLAEGLRKGEGVLVIAMREHRKLLERYLERCDVDLLAVLQTQQLLFLDAQQTLEQFIVSGEADWRQFEAVMGTAMRQVCPPKGQQGLRAYGDMVGFLWNEGQIPAVVSLARLWCKLLQQRTFKLYNAYAIDIFQEFDIAALDGVLCQQTRLVPAQPDGSLDTALDRSLEEVLGADAGALRLKIKTRHYLGRAMMPRAESMVLWLRKNLPERAGLIIDRARYYYQHPAVL